MEKFYVVNIHGGMDDCAYDYTEVCNSFDKAKEIALISFNDPEINEDGEAVVTIIEETWADGVLRRVDGCDYWTLYKGNFKKGMI